MVRTQDINVKSEKNGIKYHTVWSQMLFLLEIIYILNLY